MSAFGGKADMIFREIGHPATWRERQDLA